MPMNLDSSVAREMTRVPFTDLGAMTSEVWPEIEQDYLACLLDGAYIGGPAVTAFERGWAAYCGADHGVGVGNGTDALLLSLTALGVGPGDEVVVPANTFIATAAAVVRAGATPRFADVGDDTLLMTADTLAAAITPRTRAVIIVHLYGQVPDMAGLAAIAQRAGIAVIEDAAQAHGAEWGGRRAGSFGAVACFSFYPAKNLGAFGDAGAVTTSRPELADEIRSLANHGRSHGQSHYDHDRIGTNSRLDALQAILLSGKLAHLEEWTERRIALASRYREQLGGCEFTGTGLKLTATAPLARHVYHLFVVRVARRDSVRATLAGRGIQTGVHYPVPCHRQPPLRQLAERPLPVAERAAGEVLSLPMFPHMTDRQVDYVCESLAEALRAAAVDSETASAQ
ncbi:MAG: DegT/DnrJ/EryC1/StrS family aminotransferase [Trebonia sp.]